ncbi:MAG: hypothetical protein GX495_13630 [Chloroflexi bacterium]|jgi:hypothetical protein|nr:hypothetical protein [Chloroflexota bacterium]
MTFQSPSVSNPAYNKMTFKPSQWRFLSLRVLVMFAAYQLALALVVTFVPELLGSAYTPWLGLLSSLSFLAVFTLSSYINTRDIVDDLSIHITPRLIEGPANGRGERVRFPINKLDLARTREVCWKNHIFQYRCIWSLEGDRITVFTHAFTPAQVRAIFHQIGCE